MSVPVTVARNYPQTSQHKHYSINCQLSESVLVLPIAQRRQARRAAGAAMWADGDCGGGTNALDAL